MLSQKLLAAPLLAAPALAEPLLAVLQANGLTAFSQLLQQNPPFANLDTIGPDIIVYAPTNAALTAAGTLAGSGATLDRRDGGNNDRLTSFCMANKNAVVLKRDASFPCPPGSVYETFLSDPAWANLGPRHNQSIIEKSVSFSSRPLVFTGLGASTKVVASDIAFDGGVIRPLDGVPTLPSDLSSTLPFLNADTFENALRSAGLLSELDNRTSITVLAPTNDVLRNTSGLTGAQLTQVLKGHILVGFPIYTPLLKDGSTYSTLAGTSLTVSLQGEVATIGGAQITAGDSIITNGVVHTIDRLLAANSSSTTTGSPTTTTSPVVTAAAATTKVLPWEVLAFAFAGMAVHF